MKTKIKMLAMTLITNDDDSYSHNDYFNDNESDG
jgi:hypothetical protein